MNNSKLTNSIINAKARLGINELEHVQNALKEDNVKDPEKLNLFWKLYLNYRYRYLYKYFVIWSLIVVALYIALIVLNAAASNNGNASKTSDSPLWLTNPAVIIMLSIFLIFIIWLIVRFSFRFYVLMYLRHDKTSRGNSLTNFIIDLYDLGEPAQNAPATATPVVQDNKEAMKE